MATSRCACGNRASRNFPKCSRCYAREHAARCAEAQAIVATGKCPRCGSPLRHNLSILGWWQCEQCGAETHRARPADPPCDFQCFTC